MDAQNAIIGFLLLALGMALSGLVACYCLFRRKPVSGDNHLRVVSAAKILKAQNKLAANVLTKLMAFVPPKTNFKGDAKTPVAITCLLQAPTEVNADQKVEHYLTRQEALAKMAGNGKILLLIPSWMRAKIDAALPDKATKPHRADKPPKPSKVPPPKPAAEVKKDA